MPHLGLVVCVCGGWLLGTPRRAGVTDPWRLEDVTPFAPGHEASVWQNRMGVERGHVDKNSGHPSSNPAFSHQLCGPRQA